jgi:Domain of unknown function (DUF4145)
MVSSFGAQYSFALTNQVSEGDGDASRHMTAVAHGMVCQGCAETTIVVTEDWSTGESEILHVYPAPGAQNLDPAVEVGVASAYDEGMRCLSIHANRAAAVMFRSALHLFVKDKGSPKAQKEKHLKTALEHMKDDDDLHPSLWAWADHLNHLGNEGAHPEDYDDVTGSEAEGLGKFVRHLISSEYEMEARLRRDQGLPANADDATE